MSARRVLTLTDEQEQALPGQAARVRVAIPAIKALRGWANLDGTEGHDDHAVATTGLVRALARVTPVLALDRAAGAVRMWQAGTRQVDVVEAYGVSRARLNQWVDRISA